MSTKMLLMMGAAVGGVAWYALHVKGEAPKTGPSTSATIGPWTTVPQGWMKGTATQQARDVGTGNLTSNQGSTLPHYEGGRLGNRSSEAVTEGLTNSVADIIPTYWFPG